MDSKKQIDIVFETLHKTASRQAENGEVKIRIIERELLNDLECEDLNCMTVELFDQGSIFWDESMSSMDLMIQFKVYMEGNWMGSLSLPLKDLFVFQGVDFKQWFTLFDSPRDDIFDGDMGIDDQECPRVLFSFQFHEVDEEITELSQDPSLATSTFGEEELVVRSVQDGEYARKEQSSFGDLGLTRESVNLEDCHAYASEQGIKLDFQTNPSEPMVVPLWKHTGSFTKREAPKGAAKHKLSQSKDYGSGSKSSKDNSAKRSRQSPILDSNKKSSSSEKKLFPLKSDQDNEEVVLEFVPQPTSLEKEESGKVRRLEEQLDSALVEIERLQQKSHEKEAQFEATEDSLRQELRIVKEENVQLQSEIKHAREQNLILKKSNQTEREELLEKIAEMATQHKKMKMELERLEKLAHVNDNLLSDLPSTHGKSTTSTVLAVSHGKSNSELVFTPLSRSKEVNLEEELATKVTTFFAKKCPNLEVKNAGKNTFEVGEKKIQFKISNNILMAKAGANFLPINQYMTLYRIDSAPDFKSRNKENSPKVRPKSPAPLKPSFSSKSRSPNRFKF